MQTISTQHRSKGGGTGDGSPGVMGREAGYPRVAGAGRNDKNFVTLARYFTIGRAHRGENRYGRGRKPGVKGAGEGKFRTPCTPQRLVGALMVKSLVVVTGYHKLFSFLWLHSFIHASSI